ncbi:hypothetical protein MY1884_006542 [Beauveria asiatica]
MKLVNKDNEWWYCQFHLRTMQGIKFLTDDQAATKSPDYAQKDLYDAIARGDYPKWSVEIQIMTPKQAEEAWADKGINVFDLTHVWPHRQYPLRKIGEFTLNENAVNYFAEIEQVAFNPAHLPPGIAPSADPIRPEDFNGPKALWRKVFDEDARNRFISNVTAKMEKCRDDEPLRRQMAIFREVDPEIASRLEANIGIKGYDGISKMTFNGCHNGMSTDPQRAGANGETSCASVPLSNGAPTQGTYK